MWEEIYSRDRVASPRNPKNNFGTRRRRRRVHTCIHHTHTCSYANTTFPPSWKRINRLERCREQPVSVFANNPSPSRSLRSLTPPLGVRLNIFSSSTDRDDHRNDQSSSARNLGSAFKRVFERDVEISTARRRRGTERRVRGRMRDIENSYFCPILPRNNESRSEEEFIKVNDKPISRDRRLR